MKKFIYYLTPPLIYLLKNYIVSLFKKKDKINDLDFSNEFIDFINKRNKPKESVILGNGPSLDYYLKNQIDFFCNKTIFCVNGFVNSVYFDKIKPDYYVFYDPFFWSTNPSVKLEEYRDQIRDKISTKVNWEMYILLPKSAKKWNCFLEIENEFINIIYFDNKKPTTKNKELLFENYKNNKEIVHCQTVTVTALYLSLTMGSKINYVLGVDLSLHENLKVIDNVLHTKHVHFYDNHEEIKYVPFWKDSRHTKTFTMGEILEAYSKMFNGFYEMNEYADYLNAEVYNMSNNSYLDAFEIKKINND